MPYDPTRVREIVRTILVFGLVLGTYGPLVVIALFTGFGAMNPDDAAKAAGFLGPLVGAATLATGFYFRGPG